MQEYSSKPWKCRFTRRRAYTPVVDGRIFLDRFVRKCQYVPIVIAEYSSVYRDDSIFLKCVVRKCLYMQWWREYSWNVLSENACTYVLWWQTIPEMYCQKMTVCTVMTEYSLNVLLENSWRYWDCRIFLKCTLWY